MMNWGENIRTAMVEMWRHKLRSTLTLLGIVLGTLSITVMTSFLDGIVATVWEGFSELGYDGVIYALGREPRDLKDAAIFARSKGLQPADADVLLRRGGEIAAVAPVAFYEDLVRRGGVERKVRVYGVTSAYAEVRNRSTAAGRFIDPADEQSFARVAVLGHRLRARLYGSEDPLDKTVTLGGRRFRVVGVGEELSNMFVRDHEFIEEMEGIYIPLSTLRKLYTGDEQPVAFLAVKGKDDERLGALQADLAAGLRAAHRGARDFRIANIGEEIVRIRKDVKEQLVSWRIVMGAIAGISLLVGGIGLLSVMLISLGERLYEVGLRKAMGATDSQIFLQFLSESVVLALFGGLLGIAGGVGITKAAEGFFKSGLPVRLEGLAAAMVIALATGALYGLYPAWKASRMAPVDALREAA